MTQDDIIRMAHEAGFGPKKNDDHVLYKALECFAALVAEAERQRTVDILMQLHRNANGEHNYYHFAANEIRGFSV